MNEKERIKLLTKINEKQKSDRFLVSLFESYWYEGEQHTDLNMKTTVVVHDYEKEMDTNWTFDGYDFITDCQDEYYCYAQRRIENLINSLREGEGIW